MKIAIIGAGFTGLTAAFRLLQMGHQVILLEKNKQVGGLAQGFKKPHWDWFLDQTYHHLFTNDTAAFKLASQLNQKIFINKPLTNVFINNQILPLDSPQALLSFPYLSMIDRFRTGLVTFYLKMLNNYQPLANIRALEWLRIAMGQGPTETIWEPLFQGKFGNFKETISLVWFWARIKKRTSSLAYPEGGFQAFANRLADKITNLGSQILLNTEISQININKNHISLTPLGCRQEFDIVIITLATPAFTKITPSLPSLYVKKLSSIPHLHALTLILTSKKPFLKNVYWLNITQKNWPFLVLTEQTNFIDKKYYGQEHILYIGNYLPENHPYLKMTASQLLKIYDPFLKKINPNYTLNAIRSTLFSQPFAQPIVTTDYQQKIPQFETPLKNIYLANLDMVYPYDRGINYAIEMGGEVAQLINESSH